MIIIQKKFSACVKVEHVTRIFSLLRLLLFKSILLLLNYFKIQKFSKSECCFWSIFPPHPPRSRGSPRCGCACAVPAGRGEHTWRSKFSIMIFQIRLTLYVWHQVCPFTNFTCICFYFYWEWAELFLAPHIFTFSHPGTCSVTTCPGLGLGVPVNLVLRS